MMLLRQLRIDAGLSPEALGEKAGVTGMTIRRIEAGLRTRPKSLAAIAEALSTDERRVRATELQQILSDVDEVAA